MFAHGSQLSSPLRVDSMAAQERLRLGSGGGCRRLELRDDSSATNDRVALAAVLDAIE